MPEARDVQSVLGDAERAATAGDYIAAEALLCDAAALQEASLGPFHPDLANTLNNLGVVYETLDRPSDAERCYRRAHAIAITSLEPDHPFVATSEKNLRDFCNARGIVFEPPTPLPAIEPTATPLPPVAPDPMPVVLKTQPPAPAELKSQQPPVERPADAYVAPPPPVPSASRTYLMPVAAVLGLVVLIAAGLWFGANRNGESPQSAESAQSAAPPQSVAPPPQTVAPPPQTIAPPTQAESAAPVRESTVAPPIPAPLGTASPSERPAEPARIARGTAVSDRLTVDAATLCQNFSTRDWRCSPARSPIDSGQVFFYTRIKSSTPMTVEHRWYRDEHLHRVAALRIQANEKSGFRSYSGTAVKQGNWRVELRTRDGSVLAEEKFVVR